MSHRFDRNRSYRLDGDQLNRLEAAAEQLSGLRTLTFNEQRDLANALRMILAEAAASSKKIAAR